MKRFYCTICRRVKRVRQYPSNISSAEHNLPVERIGECAKHHEIGQLVSMMTKPEIVAPKVVVKSKRRA